MFGIARIETANITEVESTKSTRQVALDLRRTVIWRRMGLDGRTIDFLSTIDSRDDFKVFQRRQDGKKEFYRGWEQYANGFGNLNTEFWLGNDKLYKLTSNGHYKLRVNLAGFNGDKAFAKYSSFYVGDKTTNYKLTVNGYSGTADDSLKYHDNRAFSTKDKDNDSDSSDCADRYKGAWWYRECHYSNLNGLYVGNKKRFKRDVLAHLAWITVNEDYINDDS
ncbi:Hypothetical predicted protein [Mytilus galloprovincialis]|uniref:Fibrinogen C-terminal domain-containing protein n=1 Tax=Mytilus galloprovincialis TaxID=29158 RepID=A0A8B6BWQ1_MYTGA|nr:Hypothetical predicted protein [Mytilus galloprovincialis]